MCIFNKTYYGSNCQSNMCTSVHFHSEHCLSLSSWHLVFGFWFDIIVIHISLLKCFTIHYANSYPVWNNKKIILKTTNFKVESQHSFPSLTETNRKKRPVSHKWNILLFKIYLNQIINKFYKNMNVFECPFSWLALIQKQFNRNWFLLGYEPRYNKK